MGPWVYDGNLQLHPPLYRCAIGDNLLLELVIIGGGLKRVHMHASCSLQELRLTSRHRALPARRRTLASRCENNASSYSCGSIPNFYKPFRLSFNQRSYERTCDLSNHRQYVLVGALEPTQPVNNIIHALSL